MKKNNITDCESINPYDNTIPFFISMEHLARYRWAKEMLRRKKAQRVLDIACADGYGTIQLYKKGRFVLGADRDEILIKKAKAEYSDCEFDVIDIDTQAKKVVQQAPYDAICCFETLEHIQYPEKAIELFYECLNKNGYLMLSVPNEQYEPKDEKGDIVSKYHLHSFTPNQIKDMVNDCGFKIEKTLYQPMCVALHKNFSNTIRDRGVSKQELTDFFTNDKKSLDILAEVFGWPDETKGKSYSNIYYCKK